MRRNILLATLALSVSMFVLLFPDKIGAYALSFLFWLMLIYVSVIDIRRRIIPDAALASAAFPILLLRISAFGIKGAIGFALNGLSISLPLMMLILLIEKIIGKEAMGGGDIKLLFVIGAYLGALQCFAALFFACVAAVIYSVAGSSEQRSFPFAPFLTIGSVLASVFGDALLEVYFRILY